MSILPKIKENIILIGHIFLIIGGSGSGKTNAFLNLVNNQPDIDKIYLYAKDLYEDKYQFLIKKRENIGLKQSFCWVF